MFEFSRAFLYFLIQQASVVVFSVVRSKILSVFCGAEGYGLLAQAGTLILTFQVILGVGLGSGFVKLIAENTAEEAPLKRDQIVSTIFFLGSITGAIGILVTFLFSKTISGWVFGNPNYSGYVLICGLTSFFVFQYLFFLNLFRGLLEWRIFIAASVVSTGMSLVITVILIGLFRIDGGIWALLISQMCGVLVVLFFFRFKIRPRHYVCFWKVKPTSEAFHLLLSYIGPIVVVQIITSLSGLITRSLVIQKLGFDQNGLLQLSTGISDAYVGLILALLFSYVLPKISVTIGKEPNIARQIQNDSLRFSLFVISPFLVVMLAFREIWIPILYSRAFLAAGGILVWQFGGDFLLIIRRCLNIDLVPARQLKYFVVDGILFAIGMVILATVLLPRLGIYTIVICSLILNALLTLLSLTYHSKFTIFRLSVESKILLAKSTGLLCAGFAVSQWIQNFSLRFTLVAVIICLMVLFLPNKGELKRFLHDAIPDVVRQGWLASRDGRRSLSGDNLEEK